MKQEKSTLAKSWDFYEAETGDRRQTGNEEQEEEEQKNSVSFWQTNYKDRHARKARRNFSDEQM